MTDIVFQDAEKVADIWHDMSQHARDVVRMCSQDLGQALDDLLETVED
jgi:hypothetical protein